MNRLSAIRHLLAALAWLGLVLAPLAPTAVAMAASMKMAAEHHASMDMPEGMPCCPETQKKPDCADCPFLALCASALFAPVADSVGLAAPIAHLAPLIPHNDAKRSGLGQGPPARPPKA